MTDNFPMSKVYAVIAKNARMERDYCRALLSEKYELAERGYTPTREELLQRLEKAERDLVKYTALVLRKRVDK